MADPTIQVLQLDLIDGHPDRPRLVFREDVVNGIVANLGESYPQKHTILVRPVGDGYQIVSGHQRVEAARRKGLTHVWAWVEAMDDDAAFMQLVTANTQGELSPLEIGLHALKAVPKAGGGRGLKGGLSAYAVRIGKTQQYVSQLRQAAEVVEGKPTSQLVGFLDKAQHLSVIHRVHPSLWPDLLSLLLKKAWSVQETEDAVGKVAEIFGKGFDAAGSPWSSVFLDPQKVVLRLATDASFTPAKVKKLLEAADATVAMFDEYRDRCTETESLEAGWRVWLGANPNGEAWNERKHARYREELRNQLKGLIRGTAQLPGDPGSSAPHSLLVNPCDGWFHGDWREHIDKLEDGSVKLIATDPPYGMGYVSHSRAEPHAPIANDGSPEEATAELAAFLEASDSKLMPDAHALVFCGRKSEAAFTAVLEAAGFSVLSSLVWAKCAHGQGDLRTFAPAHERILHAVRGNAALYCRDPDVFTFPRVSTERHPTEKPQELMQRLIEISTVSGDLVADPFGGVATTAAAAKATGRMCWSCELDPKYWAAGENRLEETVCSPASATPSEFPPSADEPFSSTVAGDEP